MSFKKNQTFDYIIVGAGSAGCVLASRLTEDPDVRVLLLEAGQWDRDPWIHVPLGWGRIVQRRLHDWHYNVEPQANLSSRSVPCLRGKVIGGSSSTNAMSYVRGHNADYDRWAAAGLTKWSFKQSLPYFKRQESWEGGESEFRGGDGPLKTQYSRYADPLLDALIAGTQEAGHPFNSDYNGPHQDGVARLQSTIHRGRRCSNADGYLRNALARPNLKVVANVLVRSILMNGTRVTGVELAENDGSKKVIAEREVIISCGVINSPKLLMLSGIGDPVELRKVGIAPRHALRGVGRNLQDHVCSVVTFRRKGRGPFHHMMRADRAGIAVAQAYLFGTGFAADVPGGVTAFLKSPHAGQLPDIQLLLNAAPFNARLYLHPHFGGFDDTFALRMVLLRPQSRGSIILASDEPTAPPRISQNFLSMASEWDLLRDAVRMAREIASRPSIRNFVDREITFPHASKDTKDELDEQIRQTAATVNHPLGTCKAGISSDDMAVVDEDLRVMGLSNLRVVDASVMPDLVGGNINAAVTMIAERASDVIRGRVLLH